MDPLLKKIDRFEARFKELEPQILSFVPEAGRFDRLRLEAATLLERFPDPENRPALFGSLAGIKDIFHVNGLPTRAGSRLPPEVLAGEEAETVRQLKAAGALVAGKTVTTEFAYFGPGPTRNPNNLAHTPGGSSSGSAAAAAAGLCDGALGTQTIGSVNRPAAFCGIFGFKPTRERISRNGVIPLSVTFDHVGVLSADLDTVENYAAVLCRDWNPKSLKSSKVLGIPQGPYLGYAEPEGRKRFENWCRRLDEAGFDVRQVPVLADFDEIISRHNAVVAAEAARTHKTWFDSYRDSYHFKTVDLIERGRAISDSTLRMLLDAAADFRLEMQSFMDAQEIDLWLTPSAPGAAPAGLESTGDPVMNLPWTQAGLPTLTLPLERDESNLPFGLQLVGCFGKDEDLFAAGREVHACLSESA